MDVWLGCELCNLGQHLREQFDRTRGVVTADSNAPFPIDDKPRVYPMRLYGDPILRQKAKPLQPDEQLSIAGFAPQSLHEVVNTMMETMFEQRGVGLAAPQIGLSKQLFVAAEYSDDEEEGQETPLRSRVIREYVMLNPVIRVIDKRKDRSYQEGCLSIPGIFEEGVPRVRAVRVEYTDLEGQPQSVEAEDYLARIFLHEMDHLKGVMFLDHLPAAVTNAHRQELLNIQQRAKNYLQVLGLNLPTGGMGSTGSTDGIGGQIRAEQPRINQARAKKSKRKS